MVPRRKWSLLGLAAGSSGMDTELLCPGSTHLVHFTVSFIPKVFRRFMLSKQSIAFIHLHNP